MKQKDNFDFDKGFLSYDDVEKIVRRAQAERDAAIGGGVRSAFLSVVGGIRRFANAIEEARRLRALATLDEHKLMALGIDRLNLVAFVYGWKPVKPELVVHDVMGKDIESYPVRPDSIAA